MKIVADQLADYRDFVCCLVGACLLVSAASASAQLIYADSFSYPDGLIVGATGSPWVNNYEPTNEASVLSGRLVLTQAKQESIRVDFPSSSSGTLYSRMVVNFSALPQGSGNFFAFFRVSGVDNLRCRIWANTNGAAFGRFRLGITTIFFPPTMIAQDLSLGTNYLLVSRYEITNNHSALWINPADESDTTSRADDFTSVDQSSIGHFGFLQTAYYQTNSGNYIGTLTVDDLRLGRTFAEVLPLVKFTSVTNGTGGVVAMRAIGQATTNYVLQANTNLTTTNWVTVDITKTGTNGFVNLLDSNAASFPQRFYRLLKQ
jgi:hypothetical protein